MARKLTTQEKIDRFCSGLTVRKIDKALKNIDAQCFNCRFTVKGDMIGDYFKQHGHLLTHVEQKTLQYNMVLQAYIDVYEDRKKSLWELCWDMEENEIECIRNMVKAFLVRRLIKEKNSNE